MIEIISQLWGNIPTEIKYLEILIAFLSISKFISIYIWKLERNYNLSNQHIYYPNWS
jgi:hypothetical protein